MQNDLFDIHEPSERRVYSVSEITREIKTLLEDGLNALWIEGEISNFKRHSSGHLYFSMKDAECQISCVMWRGRNQGLLFQPEDGMKVRVFGDISVYERHGRYQLDVAQMIPAGVGELQMAFEALKRRLDEEGLFRSEHKKLLPEFPERIGIVTSPTGAAIRDIVSVIRRRFPSVSLILTPVHVQGEGASGEIAEAIRQFNAYDDVDLLIIGRGGGSMEDLWAFNEEVVARAIFQSEIPVISAVGHEVDFSIADFVADVRAPTPSAAAELAVRDREELLFTLHYCRGRMIQALEMRVSYIKERLQSMERSYGFRWPMDRVREYRMRLDDVSRRLETVLQRCIEGNRSEVTRLEGSLQALSPDSVLGRGYSITTRIKDGDVVLRSEDLDEEEEVRIRFHEGAVRGLVKEIEER